MSSKQYITPQTERCMKLNVRMPFFGEEERSNLVKLMNMVIMNGALQYVDMDEDVMKGKLLGYDLKIEFGDGWDTYDRFEITLCGLSDIIGDSGKLEKWLIQQLDTVNYVVEWSNKLFEKKTYVFEKGVTYSYTSLTQIINQFARQHNMLIHKLKPTEIELYYKGFSIKLTVENEYTLVYEMETHRTEDLGRHVGLFEYFISETLKAFHPLEAGGNEPSQG